MFNPILREYKISSKGKKNVFSSSADDSPLSNGFMENTISSLKFRNIVSISEFRSIYAAVAINELKIDADVVYSSLYSSLIDPLAKKYDPKRFLKERADLSQQWADHLCKSGLKVNRISGVVK